MYSPFDIQINRAIYLMKKARKILLVGHKKADSDAVGSMIALGLFLERFQKEIILSSQDLIPSRFLFLPKAKDVLSLEKIILLWQNIDLIIALDCGDYSQTGLDNFFTNKPNLSLINIDHHHDNSRFGTINIIEDNASSTSEIIYGILKKIGVPFSQEMANALLCGIFGDTDSFKNPNTTEKTLQITSSLLLLGADLKEIAKHTLQDKSVGALRLWGKILSQLAWHKKLGIVYTVVTKEDIKENENHLTDLEGIANFLNSIPEARASLILVEKENGEIKGSLRTLHKEIDVSKLAHFFGGGGHKKAAGFTISGKLVKEDGRWKID